MKKGLIEFRRAVAARNGRGRARRRFGADLRSRAVELAEAARGAGRSWQEISAELGVSATQLQKWRRGRPSSFVRVDVEQDGVAEGSSGEVRLRTPEGYEIVGLSVVELVELLRRLA